MNIRIDPVCLKNGFLQVRLFVCLYDIDESVATKTKRRETNIDVRRQCVESLVMLSGSPIGKEWLQSKHAVCGRDTKSSLTKNSILYSSMHTSLRKMTIFAMHS